MAAAELAQVGRTLHLEVIAEGVETEGQRGFVRDAGCDLVQGWLTGRPMTSESIVATFGARLSVGEHDDLNATIIG